MYTPYINVFDFQQFIFRCNKWSGVSYLMLIVLYYASVLNGKCWQLSFNTENTEVTTSAVADTGTSLSDEVGLLKIYEEFRY